MKTEKTLEYLGIYISTLEFIDKKITLLEHAEKTLADCQKKQTKLKNKFKGINLILYWLVLSAICLMPMSILNMMIETDINLMIFTPILSAIILFLYKSKNTSIMEGQIKITETAIKKADSDLKEIVGEINYSRNLSEDLLEKILISQENINLCTYDSDYLNLTVLNYTYGLLLKHQKDTIPNIVSSFRDLIQDEQYKDLKDDYNKNVLKNEYRLGALKYCEKYKN